MKIEVRCCCNPAKLIGHLDFPGLAPTSHCAINVRTMAGETVRLEIAKWSEDVAYGMGPDGLQIQKNFGVAIKSNDRPNEFWNTLPNFTPID